MSGKNDPVYKALKWTAILCGVVWIGFEAYRHAGGAGPGDAAYIAGNTLFRDAEYARAAAHYRDALARDPDHHAAMLSLANSYVQLRRYDDALAAAQKAIAMKPEFGGGYATRGIIQDHLGHYDKAIADYRRALETEPRLAEGMPWYDRLLYNIQETPPTIADRLAYLRGQMALPASERVLKMPGADARQRPYER